MSSRRQNRPVSPARTAENGRYAAARGWTGIVFIATSLDGFIARGNNTIEWLTEPDTTVAHPGDAALTAGAVAAIPGARRGAAGPGEAAGDYAGLMARVDHLVMGRNTYETVAGFPEWPYPETPVIVLSTSLPRDADARVTIAGSVAEATDLLSRARAGGVYIDGGQTVRAFLEEGLVDELTVSRAPILLGSGLPLFGGGAPEQRLRLDAAATGPNGLVHTRYTVLRDDAGAGRGSGATLRK